MTPFQAYCLYSALHAHFTTKKYDYFKYNGRLRLTQESFQKRNDRYTYNKLASHPDPNGLIISNHVYRDAKWIGDLFDEQGETVYLQWKKVNSALHYHFKQEVNQALKTVDNFNDLFVVREQYPLLLQMLYKRVVSYESVIIINKAVSFIPSWNKTIKENVQWPVTYQKLMKYEPFVTFDKEMSKSIIRESCLNILQA